MKFNQNPAYTTSKSTTVDQGLRAYMLKVYNYMASALTLTGLVALLVSNNEQLMQTIHFSGIRWVVMFAPLAFLLFGWGALMRRGSAAAVQLGFFIFAAVMGVSMSSIFLVYTPYSITQTFLVTAIAFAGLSLYGYTTKKDLSGMGTFLIMGVIGLLVAMVINIFLQSPAMMFAISAIGIMIFAGLTAFYTQDIKNTYVAHAAHGDQEWLDKAAIDGALSLYISFLNMFQFLLMFMGQQE